MRLVHIKISSFLTLFCGFSFVALFVYSYKFYKYSQNGPSPFHLLNRNFSEISSTKLDIVSIFTKAKNNIRLQTSFNLTINTLSQRTSRNLNVHVFCDSFGCLKAAEIFSSDVKRNCTLFTYDIESAAKFVKQKLRDDFLANFRHSSEAYYGDAFFFLSLVLWDFGAFSSLNRIIKIDSDLKFMANIADLWDYFDRFEGEQIIGLVGEQSPVYRHVFSLYRSQNKETLIGEPPPVGVYGFNSGIVLLDLQKIRRNAEYKSFLTSKEKTAELVAKYKFKGHLGDQDFYTLLSTDFSKFFYRLPCQWNRQLCVWWKDHGYADVFPSYNSCRGEPKVYHGNCNSPFPEA